MFGNNIRRVIVRCSYFGRKSVALLLVIILSLSPASRVAACLWEYGTDLHGHLVEVDPHNHNRILTARQKRPSVAELQAALVARKVKASSGDYHHRNDYAVALIRAGDVAQAIDILKDIETEHPGEYVTAVNLGTAYELNGELPSALKWIKTGIARNPDSHLGTEWLHVKILEAKTELASDPTWLKTHSVLRLDFGGDSSPKLPTNTVTDHLGAKKSLDDVERAIEYQLEERLFFVGPPDPVVAGLLDDLGSLYASRMSVEIAIPMYELALEYGPQDADLLKTRIAHFKSLARKNLISGWSPNDLIVGVFVTVLATAMAAIVIAVYLIVRKRKKRLLLSMN